MPALSQSARRVARPVSSAVSASPPAEVANPVDTAANAGTVLTPRELRHRANVLLAQAAEASASHDDPRVARRLVDALAGLLDCEPRDADAATQARADRAPSTVIKILAAELRRAEEDAALDSDGPSQSTAGLLVYALGGAEIGAGAALASLAALILSATRDTGFDSAPEVEIGARMAKVAAEIIRRERAARTAELATARAAAKEAARLAALPVRDPIVDAVNVAAVEGAADDLQALAAEVRARGIGGRRGAARALARVDAARVVLCGARAGRSSPRFQEAIGLERALSSLFAGGAS
jgi:hypothetical protein